MIPDKIYDYGDLCPPNCPNKTGAVYGDWKLQWILLLAWLVSLVSKKIAKIFQLLFDVMCLIWTRLRRISPIVVLALTIWYTMYTGCIVRATTFVTSITTWRQANSKAHYCTSFYLFVYLH
jgi:hypothetical protein